MSEEEAIGICKNIIRAINGETCYFNYSKEQDKEAIETLLELYHKQQKEIKELNLENQAFYEEMNCNDNEYISKKYSQLKENSISKDEVLKAMGYEENDEEYERLKQDNEKLLAILDTMYSEFCRLEDIEDQKVSVAVAFIEEKRDKHWQDKIKDKINYYDGRGYIEIVGALNELLEEN